MSVLCHRCGASLGAADLFCPNCGSPQLKFEAQEEGETNFASALPPRLPTRPQGVYWKDAVIATLIVSVPAGILSAISILSWGCCLWVVGGAVLAIGLYRKRAPAFFLDTRSGLRIGILAGLIAAYTSIAVSAIWRVFARYVLHQGATLDRFYDMLIQQSAAMIQGNPEAQAEWHTYVRFLMSPDGKAAFSLMNAATTSFGIILFSAIGGALGVRLFAGRKGSIGAS